MALGLGASGKLVLQDSSLSGDDTDNEANFVVTRVTFGLEWDVALEESLFSKFQVKAFSPLAGDMSSASLFESGI